MAKGLVDKLLDRIFDEKYIGRRGEKLTERELKLIKLFGRDGKILRNVYVPKADGTTSEIDVLFITVKGIFVFESKNYSGWVFGDESSAFWTVSLANGQKNRFYNPIRQNASHIRWLRNAAGSEIPMFSVIVFSERCELKKVVLASDDVKVIKRDRLYYTVKTIWDANPNKLTTEQVENLYAQLVSLCNVDAAVKKKHIDEIQQKYTGKNKSSQMSSAKMPEEPESNAAPTAEERACPHCGAPLVIRTAKRGEHAGESFYGCSAYPHCRYVETIHPN